MRRVFSKCGGGARKTTLSCHFLKNVLIFPCWFKRESISLLEVVSHSFQCPWYLQMEFRVFWSLDPDFPAPDSSAWVSRGAFCHGEPLGFPGVSPIFFFSDSKGWHSLGIVSPVSAAMFGAQSANSVAPEHQGSKRTPAKGVQHQDLSIWIPETQATVQLRGLVHVALLLATKTRLQN